jgi:hypothetical protein
MVDKKQTQNKKEIEDFLSSPENEPKQKIDSNNVSNKETKNKSKNTSNNEQIKAEDIIQTNDSTSDKEVSDSQTIDSNNNVQTNSSKDALIDALNIPMEEVQESPDPISSTSDSEVERDTDYNFASDDEDSFDDNLNDEDLLEDEMFFDDYKLMAEMGVEVIDLVMSSSAQLLAKDWGNEEKYSISDARKRKLKKTLELMLKKKDKKVPPELMFGITVLILYAPMMLQAIQERKKQKENQVQENIENPFGENTTTTMNTPFVIPEDAPAKVDIVPPPIQTKPVKKKAGRKKGSKDSKPRKTDGYKGNKNAK